MNIKNKIYDFIKENKDYFKNKFIPDTDFRLNFDFFNKKIKNENENENENEKKNGKKNGNVYNFIKKIYSKFTFINKKTFLKKIKNNIKEINSIAKNEKRIIYLLFNNKT